MLSKTRKPIGSLIALGLLALACSACGKASERKAVYPTAGTVLYDGKALEQAMVVLHPVDDSAPPPIRPYGISAADGTFALTTYEADDGAPAGEYLVTVECRRSSGKDEDKPPPNLLPGRYARPANSGLRVRIAPGANELPPLKLTK